MRQIIKPEYLIDAGGYLLVREDIQIAEASGEDGKYNQPSGLLTDSSSVALPKIEDEVLFMEAIHYPFEKEAVRVSVSDENALLRTLTQAEYDDPAFSYEGIARKWKVALTYDGWYIFRVYRVPVYVATVYYDLQAAVIRKGDQIITVADLEAEPSIVRYELERFYTPKTQIALDKLINEKTKQLIKEGTYTPRLRQAVELVDTIDTLHAGAHEEFDEGSKFNAQYIIETALNIVKNGK